MLLCDRVVPAVLFDGEHDGIARVLRQAAGQLAALGIAGVGMGVAGGLLQAAAQRDDLGITDFGMFVGPDLPQAAFQLAGIIVAPAAVDMKNTPST